MTLATIYVILFIAALGLLAFGNWFIMNQQPELWQWEVKFSINFRQWGAGLIFNCDWRETKYIHLQLVLLCFYVSYIIHEE